ncbi:phosphate ABC transporter permease PstA [Halalkalicoccus ordinarius]|uniref:phosphate ABC transporter permease PstA n=1 Tax=Halalkalicoccus ordinarius TaxID=3116651 RepID=UPI00300EE885
MASDATDVGKWFGDAGSIDRTTGRLFKWGCLGATALALFLMLVFLLYVFNDAFAPLSADPGWLLTFTGTVLLPMLGLGAYYYRRDPAAGRVAYTALGLPIVMGLFAGGVWLLFRHVAPPRMWFGFVVALAIVVALVRAHERIRPNATDERTVLLVGGTILALVGVPGLFPSLRNLVLSAPALPTVTVMFLLTFALPIATLAGWYVRKGRESTRAGTIALAVVLVAAGLGLVIGPVAGVLPATWVIAVSPVVGALVMYVDRVLRQGEGTSGFAFPVVVVAGILAGTAIADLADFAGPETWLNRDFLTGVHSTTAVEAGIYPALVGSVLILIVIVVSAFPVGIAAAVYLEEYAPSGGKLGRFIELIEINIANLAGVPSVVYGVLGLAIFINLLNMGVGTAVVAGFTVGLLILPIVIISTQEAIRSVPDSRRNASYAMGATKWQTVRNVVLPESMAGIFTGTILALGRAIGETAPLLMIGVPAVVRVSPESFFSRTGAMPRQILTWSTQIETDFRYGVLAAGVVTLLVVLLTMNATAIVLRNRYQQSR